MVKEAAHMMNSIVVGIIFAALAFSIRPGRPLGAVMLGIIYGLAVWVFMRYLLIPLNDPESTLFTSDRVSPQWVWWLSHAALGMTAGLFYHTVATQTLPERARRRRVELGRGH